VAEIRGPVGGRAICNLTYTLSPAGADKAIDFTEAQGNGGGDLRRGIYNVEGDRLTVSFTVGDNPRPTSFDPAADNYVIVLKCVSK
jgi:uncharacterized protein (TIGR03067 family)